MKTIVNNSAMLGGRLREERERLCLTQSLLAGKVGVSRMSQANYESGKRSPDAVYLSAAFAAGVDVGYVITAKRSAAPDFYRMSTVFVLESIERRTGFAEDVLSFVISAIADAATAEWMACTLENPESQGDTVGIVDCLPSADLDSLVAALNENARLLRDIFASIHTILSVNDALSLKGGKWLAAVLMLFRAFRSSGEVDRMVVENAIRLAVP